MNAMLVRVGVDLSVGGGSWNGPVNSQTGEFVYVAIPESNQVHPGLEKPYSALQPVLENFGRVLPPHLLNRHMHLDPDFAHLTYGDQGERAKQLARHLRPNDWIFFYAGLADILCSQRLVYALIGVVMVEEFVLAVNVPRCDRDSNAHSRRILKTSATDLIVRGYPGVSGRLARCLPIGEYRDRAYRIRRDLLDVWGGLSVKDGYLQRSARLPRFDDPLRFRRWFESQHPQLLRSNN